MQNSKNTKGGINKSMLPEKWDKEVDVVVMGYGATGAVAAITAAETGGKVLLLEKAPHAGGSSATSTGGARYVTDARQTAEYIKSLSLGSVNGETARVFAETWLEMKPWLEKHGARISVHPARAGSPRDAGKPDNFGIVFVESRDGYARGCGRDFFAFLEEEVKSLGVEVMLSTPVKKLIQNPHTKEILGVVAENGGTPTFIKAKKAVIIACGGFAGNPEMLANYINEAPVKMYPTGTPYCTGDGIQMVIDVGADLWHMNAIEWSTQSFKSPETPAAFWLQPKSQSWININKYGERFRDESSSFGHTKRNIEIFNFVPASVSADGDWPNSPWYLVFDEKVRKAGPIVLTERMSGSPPFITYNESRELYKWSRDNSVEISKGWIKKADTIAELSALICVDGAGLQKTISDYNKYCAAGVDKEHSRKSETLLPIDHPPYYALECVVGIINTQGGPRRNTKSQVMSALDGSPIPRLYAGGEFGSIWSFLYPGACNLSECIVSGLLCGRHAVAEKSWD